MLIDEDAVAVLARPVLKWQCDQITEAASWHRVLARKEPIIRIKANIGATIHRRGEEKRTKASGICRRNRLGEENPGVSTIARARSFYGDTNAFCPRRITERGDILHPGLLVEIGGEEPACLVWQHGIDAGSEIPRFARRFSCEMRAEDIITDRDECLVWAFPALDLRLSANSSNPFVSDKQARSPLSRFSDSPIGAETRHLVLGIGFGRA